MLFFASKSGIDPDLNEPTYEIAQESWENDPGGIKEVSFSLPRGGGED